jgi:L-rhamnose mutarotase
MTDFEYLSSLNANIGYHQISIHLDDKINTIFYHWSKNILLSSLGFWFEKHGAMYQQMVNKVFKNQIDQNMKAYIDDILVKSMTFKQHLQDVEKVFSVLP